MAKKTVNLMLSMVVHPRSTFVETPASIQHWSERVLSDQDPGWHLSPDAKTGIIMAGGVPRSQVEEDIAEQMQVFMRQNEVDPAGYETKIFTQATTNEDIKFVCMTASLK